MEKLKSVIPEYLKQEISYSTSENLHSTCSSLLNFFQDLPLFHQLVRDLADPEMALCGKSKEAAMEAKAKGNECFSKGDFPNALCFYSQALRVAPADVEDVNKNLIATLYLNRASSFHKVGLFLESLRDCNRALIISPSYAKAWFRRGKVNSSLENYRDAINDLKVALQMETSLNGRKQIETELNMIMDRLDQIGNHLEQSNDTGSDEELIMEMQHIYVPAKGRAMASLTNISQGSLIHKEQPYAAIILKHCRDTHCHFCFNELPEDIVPCPSCSIALYCSEECQIKSTGKHHVKKYRLNGNFYDAMEDYFRSVTSLDIHSLNLDHTSEHGHECCGTNWSTVLPSDVVLAGRIFVKYIHSNGGSDHNSNGSLDLCHNYGKLSGETKLDFHVYSIMLLHILQRYYASIIRMDSVIASQIVILLSQIRVNSMAIIRMKYLDAGQPLDYDVTSSVEQVQVAQAVYLGGSLYNHSCRPNAHAYFLSRTLFIRATENVPAGSQLELSYGPQVGQWDCCERGEFLEDRYLFTCQCNGCAQLNFSDLVINAYRCATPNCSGVVLDTDVSKYEKKKVQRLEGKTALQDCLLNDDDISKVAQKVLGHTSGKSLEPEHCLSCGADGDLKASKETITKAEIYVRRLQDAIASGEITANLVMDALKSINTLRTVLYPFNKKIAKVEDNLAQAFCSVGELQAALDHCQASIEILEKLYGRNHIVIGNELIKLASIQLCIDHKIDADTLRRLVEIFSLYYGRHTDIVFPYLKFLEREANKLVSGKGGHFSD